MTYKKLTILGAVALLAVILIVLPSASQAQNSDDASIHAQIAALQA